MKNKQYREVKDMQRKRKSLNYLAAQGKKEVVWALKPEDLPRLAQIYTIVPYLYSVKTKKFANIRTIKHHLLKDLHYNYKRGKEFIVRRLTLEDINILKDHGIHFSVKKYKIILN